MLDGPLSNSAALEPTGEFGDNQRVQLGYLWEITPMRDQTLTGHEGRTFGFSSLLQIDREAGPRSPRW